MTGKHENEAQGAQGPRCPFCGRRSSVRKIEEHLYHCDHCQKLFQA